MVASIPVFRPRLPDADRLLPYLRRIDAARIYANWGPLATEFECRLASLFAVPDGGVVSASSGTSALVGAILASAGRASDDRPIALLPALTFVATAIAVEQCGYRPHFVDVDPTTWRLDMDALASHAMLTHTGLVVAVSPFGRAMPQEACRWFQHRCGIPVVIDGGGSFEEVVEHPAAALGAVPTALSFHATKSFGVGEGGCVATTDKAVALRIQRALNFGFHSSRDSLIASTNGKMSEYQAAVGLAELDGWPVKNDAYRDVAQRYRDELSAEQRERLRVKPDVAGCYALFESPSAEWAQQLQRALTAREIEWRSWYGSGANDHGHFGTAPCDPLPVTQALLPRLVGMPMAPDLTVNQIARIAAAIASVSVPAVAS